MRKGAEARRLIAALVAHERAVISPQVLNEYASNTLRKFRHVAAGELAKDLTAMQAWCRAPMTAETPLEALAIHVRWGYAFFDCTLIAAALAFGCALFLTEDLHHGQQIGAMRIVNPFRADAAEFLAIS